MSTQETFTSSKVNYRKTKKGVNMFKVNNKDTRTTSMIVQ